MARSPLIASMVGAALAFGLAAPAVAGAQAYVPPKGDGAVAILYQNQFVDRHSLDDGSKWFFGSTRTHGLAVDFTYGLTDRLALNLGVPFVTSDYLGPLQYAHTEPRFGRTSSTDFGGWYSTFQDVRLDLRYNAVNRGPGVVTPFFSVVVPSHNYDYFGHNAAGRRISEVQVGAYAGRSLDGLLPGLFVQGRYAYALPQAVAGVRVFRSLIDGEVAYFLRPTLRVFGIMSGGISHGGIRFTQPMFFLDLDADGKIHHDRVSRVNFFNLGGGAQYSLTPTIDVFGSVMHNMSMTNGHAMKYGITAGMSWSFHLGAKKTGTGMAASQQQAALVKCLCQKGQ